MSRQISLLVFLLAVPLSAHTWPKLQNGSFDTEIWPWAMDFPSTGTARLAQEDANGNAASRSIEVEIRGDVRTRDTRLFECVAIDPNKLYAAGAKARVPSGQTGTVAARVTLAWFANGECTGEPVTFVTDTAFAAAPTWSRMELSERKPPANATHVLFILSVLREAQQGTSARALFDDAYLAAVAEKTVIPAIASLRGAFTSEWSSDLYLVNRGTADATATLLYRCMAGSVCNTRPREVVVPAKGSLLFKDAATTLFESPSSGGAVDVWSDGSPGSLIVTTRLNSRTASGTFGTEIPAISPHQVATRIFPGVRNSAAFRTNIGIYATGAPAQARIEIYVDGAVVSSRAVAIPSQTLVQLNAFEGVAVTTDNAWIRLVTSQSGVASYVSIVDNATNDVAYSTGVAEPIP
jgi:hypothetical protein